MRVRLSADEEWLQAEERAYPVTVDPSISKKVHAFSDNAYSATISNTYAYGSLRVGRDSGTHYGLTQSYVKFSLPTLSAGDMVVRGVICLAQQAGDGGYSSAVTGAKTQVNVHKVEDDWNHNSIVASNGTTGLPSDDDTVIDYQITSWHTEVTPVSFDITKLVKEWYNGTPNYGVCLKSATPDEIKYVNFMSTQNIEDPLIMIEYLNNKGLEGRWTTHTQDLGESGMGYINDYTGNLVFIAPLTGTTGNRMPVSLSLIYNGYQHGQNVDRLYTVGKGWRLNIHEKIIDTAANSDDFPEGLNTDTYPYVYEDADGTAHYLIKDETTQLISDEEGLGLTLTINSTVTDLEKYVLTSDDGGKKTFTSSGLLRKIYDDNGNFVKLFYSDVEGESGQVFKVEDGSGRAIYINRTNGVVTSITDPAGRETELFYEDGLLKRIKYPDEISTYFYYTSSGLRLNYVLARNGTRIHYKYPSAGNEADLSRVVGVMEYDSTGDSVSDAEVGNSLTIEYDKLNRTLFKDNKNRTEIYQFDNYGRTVAIKDAAGNVGQYTYQSGETISKKANTLTSASVSPKYVGNLLRDHSFEQSPSKWGVTEGTISISEEKHYLGSKSLCLQNGVDAWQKYVPTPGSTYTFSAYVRTDNSTVCPKLNVYFYDSDGAYMTGETVESETIAYTTSVWNRIHVTFSVPTGAECIYVRCATTGEGTAYFDCVQLEKGSTVNPYNMLENGNFNRTDSSVWVGVDTASSDKIYYKDDNGYFWMSGSASARKRIVQTVYVNRTANKTFFNLRATAKGNSVPLTSDSRKFALSLTAVYEDGTESSTKYVNFNPDYDETQVAAGTIGFNSSETIKKVYVRCEYAYNANDVWFDSVQVTIDESGSSYTYDDDGNLITAKDNAARKQAYTYNNAGDMLTAKDAENKQYTFNYSSTYKHRLLSAVAESADLKFSFGYDDYGNVESQTVRALDADGNATGKYIKKYTYYTDNGAYPATVYSDLGYATTYTYNNSKGILTKSVDPRDYTLNYTYNANNDRLTKVTDGTSTVEYTYNIRGRLTTVKTNSTTYSFSYDAFGNNTLVKAGDKKLVTNAYNSNNGTLESATYGNGDYINYYYDSLDRVTSVAYNGYTKHKWNYNANGQVGRYTDKVSGKTYDYTYDGIGRLIRTNVSDGSRIRAYYNTMDQLSEIHYRFADNGGKDVYYTYSLNDNQQLSVSFGSNSAYQVQSRYDSLRRLDHNTLVTPDEDVADVDVYYSYRDRSDQENRTTSLVKGIDYQYVSGGLSIHDPYYKYDSTGNITSEWVWDSGDTTGAQKEKYTYSTSGQLTRHDSATQNKSFTYSYDEAGNLLTKRTYAYTTGTLGSSTDSVTYAYSTGTWGDLLTAYDGKSITYDEMGNMKTFDGATFTWQGRQLASRAKNGTTTTYKYNSDGIRTSKTVGSTKTEYFLNGSQILAQKAGDNVMWFFYDANGTRVGLISNGYMFYYLYNLQGDVIALVRASTGQIVAKYTYDAWGKCTTTNLDGWTVGTRNPFRYRGYYYDSESGLYYLNSRYYDPELGRFISPDTTAILTATPAALTDKNLYAYCDNNPVMRTDNGGNLWNVVIGATVGAVAGVVGQVVSDAVTSVLNGKVTISNWQTYTGAAVGGATGGVVLATTGNMNMANAVTGAVTTGVGQSLEKITISNYNKSWAEIGANSVVDGVVSYRLGKIPGIKGATAGRNSWSAVYKSGLTKLRNGTATRMSAQVVAKGLGSSVVGGFALDGYYGVKQYAYDRVKNLLAWGLGR